MLQFLNIWEFSGGRVAYFGPRDEMISYFGSIGLECPIYTNPADFAIDIISVDNRDKRVEQFTQKRLSLLCQIYQTSQLAQETLGSSIFL
jgi:hypothetical protein